ncbi:MAG: SDR family NAD(P)-dependent oxidoreductase [bacterium]
MSKDLIVITGATGNIGKPLAEALLAKGAKVRVVGRTAERLAPLAAKGAEVFAGSVEDETAMRHAFEGASAVFAMIPPNYATPVARAYQNTVGNAYMKALRASPVKHVVTLSSVGAQLSSGNGPISGLHDLEQRLNGLDGVAVLHLRPTFFMENCLLGIGLIKSMGIFGSPMKGDVATAMIATRDIAAAACDVLANRGWSGKSTRELLGPRDLSNREATRAIGAAIGKPDLAYVEFPYEDAEKALLGMGMTPDWAATMIDLYRGFNEGRVAATEARSKENTTPTTIEEFAATTFAAAYNAG